MKEFSINQDLLASASKCNLQDFFKLPILEALTKELGLLKRRRKVSHAKVFLTLLGMVCAANKETAVSIEELRLQFIKTAGVSIEPKPFHNAIRKPEMMEFCKLLLAKIYSAVYSFTAKFSDAAVQRLASELGVNDIVAIDGVEVPLRLNCAENFGSRYRSKNGEGAALKLHVAYSLLTKSIKYIDITCGRECELRHVNTQYLQGCLVLMDRGYSSLSLEDELHDQGIKFIIRGKSSNTGRVLQAYRADGIALKHSRYNGWSLKGLISEQSTRDKDTDFLTNDGRVRRFVFIRKPDYVTRTDCKFGIYHTNLPRTVSARTIYLLYRCRWAVELQAKAMKQGCSLTGINSGLETIVMMYITACLTAAAFKYYFGVRAFKDNLTQMSLLQVFTVFDPFKELFQKMAAGYKRTSICQCFKRIIEFLQQNCRRSQPSQRDQQRLKDLPLLLKDIIASVKSGKRKHSSYNITFNEDAMRVILP